ncbi:hypothetical protein EDEG_03858 [Edhazardia aedis USNM 41457]|uniref:Uncharacterized protein n=1 Tax=Edhazardia aedis (strain USNM 41457) TaxID=1003232 RepID=J9DG85_EDHAE|nr:hypothetical protein EDEG_03858 [Edhazardia aedis USNM 41457]|eukprot:EJW01600.1 hypothetical protein EDEG_03858 [Edhazardia aedis USNM 41457]
MLNFNLKLIFTYFSLYTLSTGINIDEIQRMIIQSYNLTKSYERDLITAKHNLIGLELCTSNLFCNPPNFSTNSNSNQLDRNIMEAKAKVEMIELKLKNESMRTDVLESQLVEYLKNKN